MNRKAVEMSLNTVVIIVIVLLVLLVVAFILTGGFKNLVKGSDCQTKGYQCQDRCEGSYPTPQGWACEDKGKVCCGPPLIER